ncbi:MAG: GntR family transcriptional regulator [Deltaproteobacteria bacterium]|nr:GntR family transcriptional regulator [Deltaproteobacteria bacterium]
MVISLEDQAYNKIKVAISKGYVKKGSKLKEIPLSKTLGMSRATVKGAVKRLVFEGLAEYSPNKGASVVDPSLEEIKESFLVRAQLEKMAASLSAEKLGPDDFDCLHKLIRKEKDIFKARKLDQYYEINNAIHLKIAEKSGNRVLVHYIKELLQKTTIYLILFDPFYQLLDTNNTSPLEHLKIVQWLEKKNGDKAGLAIEHHLKSTMSGIDVERLFPDDYLAV